MTCFTVHTNDSAPAEARPDMAAAEDTFGFVPNVLAVLAESPSALGGYLTLTRLLERSAFSPSEQQFLLLAISAVNGCDYCVAAHSLGGDKSGLDAKVIEAVRLGNPVPDSKLRALFDFTKTLVETRGWVPESDIDHFFAAGYSKRHILDAVLAVSLKTLSNYVNHIAGTPLDRALEAGRWKQTETA